MATKERGEGMSKEIKIKCWPEFFEPIRLGNKRAEFRLDDRDYQVFDILIIQEWNPNNLRYTGRQVKRLISHKVAGGYFGIPKGYCMLSLKTLPKKDQPND